nr:reverse transcriptase domain-containing protein [Tanacetum cinerariifolium]
MARTTMNEHCSAVIFNKLPRKLGDHGKFLIPCEFSGLDECLALADLGASINLMPLSVWEGLSLPELTPTCMTLEFADHSVSKPIGIAKDVSFKVGVFHFPADFVVVDFEPDPRVPLILGRCFLKTSRALIDVHKGELTLRIGNEAITYNLDQTLLVIIAKELRSEEKAALRSEEKAALIKVLKSHKRAIAWKLSDIQEKNTPFVFSEDCIQSFQTLKKKLMEAPILIAPNWDLPFELMCDASDFAIGAVLGQRHEKHFKPINYARKTMNEAETNYTTTEKEMLAVVYAFEKFRSYLIMNKSIVHTDHSALKYLFAKKDAKARLLRWVLLLQEFNFQVLDTKRAENLAADHLSRLENPYENVLDPKEINKKFPLETLGMVTFRGDSSALWFADFANYHAGNFIVKVTGWRVCIDYCKLNEATRKDHFPLPFMDQMLKRLAGNEYYCFLNGFSEYFQIPIDPRDQEKKTFTCPYGTFAYRRMPFGLCNAPGTFQRYKMLQRCEDTNLSLNWEKSHFMVKEGIVIGHKISKNGIEVDRAKVDVIAKFPHPTTVK